MAFTFPINNKTSLVPTKKTSGFTFPGFSPKPQEVATQPKTFELSAETPEPKTVESTPTTFTPSTATTSQSDIGKTPEKGEASILSSVGEFAKEMVVSPVRELARVSIGGLLAPFVDDKTLENVPVLGDISPIETFSEAFGGAGEIALTFIPGGKAVKEGATALKGALTATEKLKKPLFESLKQSVKSSTKLGLLGGGFGVSEALQENKEFEDVIQSGLVGFGAGFGLGVTGEAVLGGISKFRSLIKKTPEGEIIGNINSGLSTLDNTLSTLDHIPMKSLSPSPEDFKIGTVSQLSKKVAELKSGFKQFIFSPQTTLKETKGGRKILDMINTVERNTTRETAKTMTRIQDAGLSAIEKSSGKTNAMNRYKEEVIDILEGRRELTSASKEAQKVASAAREELDKTFGEATSQHFEKIEKFTKRAEELSNAGDFAAAEKVQAKVEKLTEEGRLALTKYRKDFFPHQIPDPDTLLTDNQLTRDILKNTVRQGIFPDIKTARLEMNKFANFMNGKEDVPANIVDRVLQSSPQFTREEAVGLVRNFRTGYNQGSFSGFKERIADIPFYDPDISRVLPRYFSGANKAVQGQKVYGAGNWRMGAAISDVVKESGDASKGEFIKNLLETMNNKTREGKTAATRLLGFMRGIQTASKLDFSVISNMTQSVNSVLKADLPTFAKALTEFTNKDSLEFVRKTGVWDDIIRAPDIEGGGITSTILKASGFTKIEGFNRGVAALTGKKYAEGILKSLKKTPDHVNGRRILKSLFPTQVGDDVIDSVIKNGFTENQLLDVAAKFVEDTQFVTKATNIPLWAQTPLGRSLFQFKSFSYHQTRFLYEQTIKEVREGSAGRAMRNVAVLATLFPIVGEVKEGIRNLIVGREREFKSKTERYFENISSVGGFGLAMDMIDASERGRVTDFLLGPTGGDIADIMESIAKDIKNKEVKATAMKAAKFVPFSDPIMNRLFPSKQQQQLKKNPKKSANFVIPFTSEKLF